MLNRLTGWTGDTGRIQTVNMFNRLTEQVKQVFKQLNMLNRLTEQVKQVFKQLNRLTKQT